MLNVYVIQIILILFFGLLFREDKKKFLTAAFFVLFVVMAFRNATIVGNDSATSYYTQFNIIQNDELPWPNPGLPIIMKGIHLFSFSYQWVIIISAIWVCFAYYRLLVKYSENSFISVMWFMGMLFYTFFFSALKQAWAMGFLCFAFDAIFEKKPFRFLILVGFATIFHFPALVFLPAYWIAKSKINKAFPVLMFSVLVVVFIFRTQILDLMTTTYAKGEGEYSSDVSFIGTKFIFMVLMLAFGFYQYFSQNFNISDESNTFSALIYFMGIAAVIQTFCYYNNIFERLADYYYQFSILFVPLILSRKDYVASQIEQNEHGLTHLTQNSTGTLNKKSIRNYTLSDIDIVTVLSVIISAFCVWRFLSYTGSGADNLTPFYFLWQWKQSAVV